MRALKTVNVESESGLKICLDLRNAITIVAGDSSIGKSYLYQLLQDLQLEAKSAADKTSVYLNIEFIDRTTSWDTVKSVIRGSRGKLIVIDNADLVFLEDKTCELGNYVSSDKYNQYLIFARGSIGVSTPPVNYTEYMIDKGVCYLKYSDYWS